MVKKLITEISEEDFRKLNLKVYKTEREECESGGHRFALVEKSLNDILDEQIEYTIKSGYPSDLYDLRTPVTIAIHEEPSEEDYQEYVEQYKGLSADEARETCRHACGTYLDKFMNRFTGAQTYQIGWGIRHLYSTRDYYEAHEDYWRVRKDETKVIYRVRLSDKWEKEFVLKHKTDTVIWPYDYLPEGVSPDYLSASLAINYDLIDGEWVECSRCGIFKYLYSEHHVPVDKDGKEKFRK